jgi:hypothetical protein
MRRTFFAAIPVLTAALACAPIIAQPPAQPQNSYAPTPDAASVRNLQSGPVVLDWTPPALAGLSAQASSKSSFTLDRTMLGAAAALLPDSEAETRQAIGKLDGVSVHLLRFGPAGIPGEALVEQIRTAYHLRGWKHLVSTTGAGGPVHNGTTDVWLVVDGANVRGAVVLAETPKSLTLVTVAGNLNTVDLRHLRGHFGIPRFAGDGFKDAKDR